MKTPEQIQREYYERTASSYDQMHVNLHDEHYNALSYIECLSSRFHLKTFLDVGCGTGRAVQHLSESGFRAVGVEPVLSLLSQAVRKKVPEDRLVCANGQCLPFKNESFDAVCSFGTLHHVKHPDIVVKEMMRVSRKAVFLSDSNRFGQGSPILRFVKLALYKTKLWKIADLIKTHGKGYAISEGDGLAYSYSIFDSFQTLSSWADTIIPIPTSNEKAGRWLHPLLTSSHVLLCALKGPGKTEQGGCPRSAPRPHEE